MSYKGNLVHGRIAVEPVSAYKLDKGHSHPFLHVFRKFVWICCHWGVEVLIRN